jgi:hypothetical protein
LAREIAGKVGEMTRSIFTAMAVTAVIGTAISPTSASAGHNDAVGAGLLGLGIGAIVGSALTPREVYVVPPPPPPPPAYYGPVGYVPEPWSPGWYRYCRGTYGPSFNPRTGYFQAADGGWYFCD